MKYRIKQLSKGYETKMDLVKAIQKDMDSVFGKKKETYKTQGEAVLKSSMFNSRFEPKIEVSTDIIEVKAVINTTNVIDSHLDLHMPKIWNKTVEDNPYSYHLKQHEGVFESVLSNKAKSYNEEMNFMELGLGINFPTTANINQFTLKRSDNPLMFNKYAEGSVLQHSVGMFYVNIELAMYDEDSEKNMAFFEMAKSNAINPEVADENGYVWVVTEAKKREGSAVVFGSNSITPTLHVIDYDNTYEPLFKGTRKDTKPNKSHLEGIDYKAIAQNFTLK
jgi:hypothetical protein